MVEDAPAGVRSEAAGARVIALCTTMAGRELRQSGADWVVKDCAAISLDRAEFATENYRSYCERTARSGSDGSASPLPCGATSYAMNEELAP